MKRLLEIFPTLFCMTCFVIAYLNKDLYQLIFVGILLICQVISTKE